MGGQCSLVPQPEVLIVRPDGTVMRQGGHGQTAGHYPYAQPFHPGQGYYPGGPPQPGYPYGTQHDQYQAGSGHYRSPHPPSMYGCRYPPNKYVEIQEQKPVEKKVDKFCRFIEMHHEGDRKLIKFFEGNFAPSAFGSHRPPPPMPQVEAPKVEVLQVPPRPPYSTYATSVDFAKKYKYINQSETQSGAVFHTTLSDHTGEDEWEKPSTYSKIPTSQPGMSDAKFSVTQQSKQVTSVSQYDNKPRGKKSVVSDAIFHVTMHSTQPETIKCSRKTPRPCSKITSKQGMSDAIFNVTMNSAQQNDSKNQGCEPSSHSTVREELNFKTYQNKESSAKVYAAAAPIVPNSSPPTGCLCLLPAEPIKPPPPKTKNPSPSQPSSEQSKSSKNSNAYSSYNSKKKLSTLVKRIRTLLKEQKQDKSINNKFSKPDDNDDLDDDSSSDD